MAKKVDNVQADILIPFIKQRVLPESIIYTDELNTYRRLGKEGYFHKRVHHSSKVYVDGPVHTNTIDGFWSLVKNGIRGVYHSVSDKYLQTYLDEYTFRYNRRDSQQPMFKAFLGRVRKTPPVEMAACG